jgi:hypothetical protein
LNFQVLLGVRREVSEMETRDTPLQVFPGSCVYEIKNSETRQSEALGKNFIIERKYTLKREYGLLERVVAYRLFLVGFILNLGMWFKVTEDTG